MPARLTETERGSIRDGTLEGLDAAARQGRRRNRRSHPARPGHPHRQPPRTVPGVASIYGALAAHAKAQSYPDAIDQAHTEFVALPTDSR